jgi:hypothetical protein
MPLVSGVPEIRSPAPPGSKVMTVPAWPALACGPIGRHRYLEILDNGQVLDDSLAITAPHVNSIQEMNSDGHDWRRSIASGADPAQTGGTISLGEVQNSRDLSVDDRESVEPYVYGLGEAIKIQANLAASRMSC